MTNEPMTGSGIRIMIPILDRKGNPIAFGGRVLQPEAQPKYMNSPQTPLI